jgi:RNA polymerase sigma-70 factor (sigma-E family)
VGVVADLRASTQPLPCAAASYGVKGVNGIRTDDETTYREFAAVHLQTLQRPAYLLCGDWHAAQDLVQTALVKMYAAWPRLGDDVDRHAYVRRVLVNTYISSRRRHWWRREVSSSAVVDVASVPVDPDERESQRVLLLTLPPRQRAVVVLRFWEDFSVEQTAQALGIAAGTVKSQTSEALKTLRITITEQERSAP